MILHISFDKNGIPVFELIYLLVYQILYEGTNERKTQKQPIYNEACAIYQVFYEYAKSNKDENFYFAWHVAGEDLCDIYIHN